MNWRPDARSLLLGGILGTLITLVLSMWWWLPTLAVVRSPARPGPTLVCLDALVQVGGSHRTLPHVHQEPVHGWATALQDGRHHEQPEGLGQRTCRPAMGSQGFL
jgi:hypothetical protein